MFFAIIALVIKAFKRIGSSHGRAFGGIWIHSKSGVEGNGAPTKFILRGKGTLVVLQGFYGVWRSWLARAVWDREVEGENCRWQFGQPETLRKLLPESRRGRESARSAELVTESWARTFTI